MNALMKKDMDQAHHRMSLLSEKLRRNKIKTTASEATTMILKTNQNLSSDAQLSSAPIQNSNTISTSDACVENNSRYSLTRLYEPETFKWNEAETPRRSNNNHSHRRDASLDDSLPTAPLTPTSLNIQTDINLSISPEIDRDNKSDDEESLLDSVLNEEMEHLATFKFSDNLSSPKPDLPNIDVDSFQPLISRAEEDDYSSLISELSSEYTNQEQLKDTHNIDAKKNLSLENQISLVRDKVMRLKLQNLNTECISEYSKKDDLIKKDANMSTRLDEILEKVIGVQKENDELRRINRHLMSVIGFQEVQQLHLPLPENDITNGDFQLINDGIKDNVHLNVDSSKDSFDIDNIRSYVQKELSDVEHYRREYEDTKTKIKRRKEMCEDIIRDLNQVHPLHSCPVCKGVPYLKMTDIKDRGMDSRNVENINDILNRLLDLEKKENPEMIQLQQAKLMRNEDLEKIATLGFENVQQRVVISSLERQVKEQNISIITLESHVESLNYNMMIARHDHEAEKERLHQAYEDLKTQAVQLITWMKPKITERQDGRAIELKNARDDSDLESLTKSEKERLNNEIEDEKMKMLSKLSSIVPKLHEISLADIQHFDDRSLESTITSQTNAS